MSNMPGRASAVVSQRWNRPATGNPPPRLDVTPLHPAPAAGARSPLIAALERCPLLAGVSPEDVCEIAADCRTADFDAQEEIFEEGQHCDGLWVLAKGRVRLYHSDADGHQHIVSFRGPSAPLELAAALDGRPYSASATALEPCTLIFLPHAMLSALSRRYPITIRNVVDQLCIELRQRDISNAIAALRDARGRICCALLQLLREYGTAVNGAQRIDYRLTRQDIADRSGVTLETAIRVLSEFQRRGIIRTQSQVIDILNLPMLTQVAQCAECQFDCSVFASPAKHHA